MTRTGALDRRVVIAVALFAIGVATYGGERLAWSAIAGAPASAAWRLWRDHGPDAVWAASLALVMGLFDARVGGRLWRVAGAAAVIGVEVAQRIGWLRGTFDAWDLVVMGVAYGTALVGARRGVSHPTRSAARQAA